jgi:hypothetical protein
MAGYFGSFLPLLDDAVLELISLVVAVLSELTANVLGAFPL